MNPRIKNFVSSRVSCQMSKVKGSPKGFTLLELLIVVSIIAILSVALVLVLDPAETLKKSRDAQRMSDMSTIKTAIGLYTTSTTTPYIGGLTNNNGCKAAPSTLWNISQSARIFYSVSGVTDTILDGQTGTATTVATSSATATLTDGTGWIPVNFDSLIGGSPISNLPVDPVNALGTDPATISDTTLAYRYACSVTPLAYEIDAVLESDTYTTGSDNKLTKDGGNNANFYEVGTNLKIFGTGNDF